MQIHLWWWLLIFLLWFCVSLFLCVRLSLSGRLRGNALSLWYCLARSLDCLWNSSWYSLPLQYLFNVSFIWPPSLAEALTLVWSQRAAALVLVNQLFLVILVAKLLRWSCCNILMLALKILFKTKLIFCVRITNSSIQLFMWDLLTS